MTHLKPFAALVAFSALALAACGTQSPIQPETVAPTAKLASAPVPSNLATAIFAGGCFWCMEKPFDEIPGVVATTSGYTGGTLANPTYEQVGRGGTGHFEAVKVTYDPSKVSYQKLLDTYWLQIDPFDAFGQFCDKGETYLPAIFYGNDDEKKAAEAAREILFARFKKPIVVQILPAKTFYDAEGYHQDYYQKNPLRYAYYRNGCGRDARLRAVWGQ
ncbi:peptide-methionine (S)-S-oxide reductase MsrA [Aquidulcibacter sp.]|uniref:peptide-methionine (S)-S-oxide reductase MsrA n=1 Tax=Aquidulcibacter sp. TaxID=2052990 RepID=UPI0025BDED6A|nr:peptide-methionine (S)-S-oxide reductase MsrA [Aquidulcibacter sp.]MCA3691845.1 peptide-methionine (S)-S-oxide reductase MsrA [Aquidulcibacter sp.]